MMRLGLDKNTVRAGSYARKSYWATSKTYPVQLITNERLKRKGLVMPLDHYLKVHTVI